MTTPDGRTLSVLESGDPTGKPILVHAGMPNSQLQYGPVVHIAERQGVRLISYDRPGYGRSSPQPGRYMASRGGRRSRSGERPEDDFNLQSKVRLCDVARQMSP